jgi:glycine cleavage system H protein
MSVETVSGFAVDTALAYDIDHHMWVHVLESGHVQIGMDALGIETSGTLAQLAFVAGAEFARGEAFGTLEAEKFVGPLVAPVSGNTVAVNEATLADPGLVERDPYGAGWFIEVAPTNLDEELGQLTRDAAQIVGEFERKVRQYRLEGVLAE